MRQAVSVIGMHGLGDNIHQRGIIRHLMATRDVWLETPWPCVYHDLVGQGLRLAGKSSRLRTQAKNAAREADRFHAMRAPGGLHEISVRYDPDDVRATGSVFAAMAQACGVDAEACDFRLPVPAEWAAKADALFAAWRPTKPLMIYRPLVERTEWGGCRARNPDHAAYAALFETIRERFFVISVADLEPGKEWLAGIEAEADVRLHAGELDFETLAALTARAGLVFSSPGFAVILAQSVGAPSVCVFGGYENGTSFSFGSRFAPHLAIEPIEPCQCFRHDHHCRKAIDMSAATARLLEFVHETADHTAIAS